MRGPPRLALAAGLAHGEPVRGADGQPCLLSRPPGYHHLERGAWPPPPTGTWSDQRPTCSGAPRQRDTPPKPSAAPGVPPEVEPAVPGWTRAAGLDGAARQGRVGASSEQGPGNAAPGPAAAVGEWHPIGAGHTAGAPRHARRSGAGTPHRRHATASANSSSSSSQVTDDHEHVPVPRLPGIPNQMPQAALSAPGNQVHRRAFTPGHVHVDDPHTRAQPTEEGGHRSATHQGQRVVQRPGPNAGHHLVRRVQRAPRTRAEQLLVNLSGSNRRPSRRDLGMRRCRDTPRTGVRVTPAALGCYLHS